MTTPSTVKCAVAASAAPASFAATGGNGTLTISTNRDCQWSAAAAGAWIQLTGSTAGQGSDSVSFSVAANADAAVRKGAIAVADQQVNISQDAASCSFTVAPRNDSVDAVGGQKTIVVTASSRQCTWSARSDVEWLSILSGSQGTGSGQVSYAARATAGPARSGTLLVAGQMVTIAQGGDCHYTIDPTSPSIVASGGAGSVNVHSSAGCEWKAVSNAPWLTIISGTTGSGDGHVVFTAAASTGPARSGTLTVAGQTFTLTQASGCTYGLVPASQNLSDAAATSQFAVNTSLGCTWTAESHAGWIAIAGASSGAGPGAVTYHVDGNAMGLPARSGSIGVNDQTFTVNQTAGAACVYVLAPTSQSFSAAPGTGSFAVTTVLTCPWTAYSNVPWIAITGSPSGAGIGAVTFSLGENPAGSPARTGTISVRGQTFTVSQAASGTQ